MLSFLFFFCVVAGAAVLGAQFQPGPWFGALAKPAWNPPNWVFGPVWSVLYICVAVAGWRVWRRRPSGSTALLALWAAQMILNTLWSVLFFGLHRPDMALLDICLLLVAIALFLVRAWPVERVAAALFAPYLLWVSFAAFLNFTLWRFNPL